MKIKLLCLCLLLNGCASQSKPTPTVVVHTYPPEAIVLGEFYPKQKYRKYTTTDIAHGIFHRPIPGLTTDFQVQEIWASDDVKLESVRKEYVDNSYYYVEYHATGIWTYDGETTEPLRK